jgi:hypothetical protein
LASDAAAKLLTRDQARRIAANIAKLPEAVAALPWEPAPKAPLGSSFQRRYALHQSLLAIHCPDYDHVGYVGADRPPRES